MQSIISAETSITQPVQINYGVEEVVGSLQLVPEEEVGLTELELFQLRTKVCFSLERDYSNKRCHFMANQCEGKCQFIKLVFL